MFPKKSMPQKPDSDNISVSIKKKAPGKVNNKLAIALKGLKAAK